MGHLGGTPAEPERQERDVALAAKRPKCVERVDQFDCRAAASGRAAQPRLIPIAADPCLQFVAENFARVAARRLVKDANLARGTAVTYICDSVNGYV